VPDLVENNGLDGRFEHGKSCSEFRRLTARIDELHPSGTVKCPVRMQQRCWNDTFKLKDVGSQRGEDEGLCAERCATPCELARRRQTELVREMAPLVALVGVLVLVECQWISAVQVLVMLVVAVHTCVDSSI